MGMNLESDILILQEILDHSKRIVFFGGAGVSTGSGIPDFRSDNDFIPVSSKVFPRKQF